MAEKWGHACASDFKQLVLKLFLRQYLCWGTVKVLETLEENIKAFLEMRKTILGNVTSPESKINQQMAISSM